MEMFGTGVHSQGSDQKQTANKECNEGEVTVSLKQSTVLHVSTGNAKNAHNEGQKAKYAQHGIGTDTREAIFEEDIFVFFITSWIWRGVEPCLTAVSAEMVSMVGFESRVVFDANNQYGAINQQITAKTEAQWVDQQ